jgi:hypothetical protein
MNCVGNENSKHVTNGTAYVRYASFQSFEQLQALAQTGDLET